MIETIICLLVLACVGAVAWLWRVVKAQEKKIEKNRRAAWEHSHPHKFLMNEPVMVRVTRATNSGEVHHEWKKGRIFNTHVDHDCIYGINHSGNRYTVWVDEWKSTGSFSESLIKKAKTT